MVEVVLLLQKSATSLGWTPGTSSHYLPNSHLFLREVACAQQRPHPGTPCWLTHKITACCLHKLIKTAYSDCCTEPAVSSDEVYSFEAWCDSRKERSPKLQSWYLVLSMELEILSLSSDCSGKLPSTYTVSWTIPILLRQLQCELRTIASHPSERHVDAGGETHLACPCIPEMSICCTQIIDQTHDRPTNGGAIGVTEDPTTLGRWMIAGPDVGTR